MTASAARTEVLNLDRSAEEEKERSKEENSKDGTLSLMAMAIAQALLIKKQQLAVYKDENARLVEQGPAANQPADDSQSLVQVDESQGRRGAMAGCMSQGGTKLTRSSNSILLTPHFFHAGGCNEAFTIASGNRAGNSERALAEAAATVTRKAGEGDLAEIKIIETEQDKKLAPSATDHTATLDGQQYTSELQSMKKTEETVEGAETLMESTAPNSTAPTTVAAPTSALCADTEPATTCGLAKQLCYIKEGQGTKDFCTTKLLTSCMQALGLCGANPNTTKRAEIVANATSTKTEIQSPTATTKNIALCDGDQGGSLPCSRVKPQSADDKPSVSTPAPLFLASLCLLPSMPPCDTLAETCLAGMSRRPEQGKVLCSVWKGKGQMRPTQVPSVSHRCPHGGLPPSIYLSLSRTHSPPLLQWRTGNRASHCIHPQIPWAEWEICCPHQGVKIGDPMRRPDPSDCSLASNIRTKATRKSSVSFSSAWSAPWTPPLPAVHTKRASAQRSGVQTASLVLLAPTCPCVTVDACSATASLSRANGQTEPGQRTPGARKLSRRGLWTSVC